MPELHVARAVERPRRKRVVHAEIIGPPLLLTMQQTAATLSLGLNTVRDHVKGGRIRTVLVGGRPMVPYSEAERIAREGLEK